MLRRGKLTPSRDPALVALLLSYHKQLCLVIDHQGRELKKPHVDPTTVLTPLDEFIGMLSGTIEEIRHVEK